ncbi:hypothetical protein Lepto7375DRAFT_1759 [Leptolyngbya sp. PCC 7375]|nr:hypothetical protein Lepto7375DRAFT_1759 [Leptolyngbya sp. PCC 7375]
MVEVKLIFCPQCEDVRKLAFDLRRCFCGEAWGHYCDDGLNAVIGGGAIPLGFENKSFVEALKTRPVDRMGKRFEAFVIPEKCPTVIDET